MSRYDRGYRRDLRQCRGDRKQSEDSTLIDGVPTLVVEILSPSDTIEDVNEKIDTYLAAKVL